MQPSRNQDVLFPVSDRYERYCIAKRYSRTGSPREILFERESNEVDIEQDAQRNETAYCLNAGGDKHRGSYIKQLNNPTHSNNRLYADDGISPALNTAQGGNRQPKIPEVSRIRRLTVTECEKLMSWPPNWTKYGRKEDGTVYEMSSSQRYKMAGNGVVSKVVEAIIKEHFL
jgi:site-specific DNA-cytosine methylase